VRACPHEASEALIALRRRLVRRYVCRVSDTSRVATDAKVLTLDSIRWAIATLKSAKIHRHFFAFLYVMRTRSLDGEDEIHPDWTAFEPYLRLPTSLEGVYPDKQFYVPLDEKNVRDQSSYWLNRNLRGSYATSSLRRKSSFMVAGDNAYRLPPDFGATASLNFLGGEPVSAPATAAYLLRNHAFPPTTSTVDDLISEFRNHFGFDTIDGGDEAFSHLFGDAELLRPPVSFTWFEGFTAQGEPEPESEAGNA
jgi:hypothetical protein